MGAENMFASTKQEMSKVAKFLGWFMVFVVVDHDAD